MNAVICKKCKKPISHTQSISHNGMCGLCYDGYGATSKIFDKLKFMGKKTKRSGRS